MIVLLGTTLTASFFDSLNPSAIVQQMVLQAMVKRKRQIWFFIFGIALANLLLGLAVYYGLAAWVWRWVEGLLQDHPLPVYGACGAGGAALFLLGVWLLWKTRQSRRQGVSQQEGPAKAPAQLSPLSLFLMGAGFCLVELTSALPYFGFLALLATYQLAFPGALLFMLLYDFMYVLPLILLYFGYNKLQGTGAIRRLESLLGNVSAYLVPGVTAIAGAALAWWAGSGLAG